MRYIIDFYYGDKLVSVINVDTDRREVAVENAEVRDPVVLAFGINTEPAWKDYEEFLEDRCVPRTRFAIKEYLKQIGLDYYNPFEICKKTQGRLAGDAFWMEIKEVV